MMEVHGTCQKCGQYVLVQVDEDATEEEVNEAATLTCGCKGSQEEKELKESIGKCRENIKTIFGKGRIAEILQDAAEDVRSGEIEQMTLKLDKRTTAKLWVDASGKVAVEKKIIQKVSANA